MDASGDPVAALDEACRLLGVRGRVLPSATEPVVLKAEAAGGPVTGQVAVNGTDHILTGVPGARRPARPRGGARGPGRRRPDPARPGIAVHQRAGRRRGAPDPRRHQPRRRPSGSTSATCTPRTPRRPATTSPGTSPPSWPTGWRSTGWSAIRPGSRWASRSSRSSTCPWPGPTDWPTTRPNWRRPSPICSDDPPDPPDALAWTCSACRRGDGTARRDANGSRSRWRPCHEACDEG